MDEYIKQKPIRLANYDYAAPGAYFVTVCTYEKRCILSGITAGNRNDHARVDLSPVGRITEEQLMRIPRRFPCVTIDKFVIMPNHIHILLTRTGNETGGASPSLTTVVDAVRVFKSLATRLARPLISAPSLFQRSFYDHIVRNDEDYRNIWDYIESNPDKWSADCFYE